MSDRQSVARTEETFGGFRDLLRAAVVGMTLLLATALSLAADDPATVTTDVFQSGTDGYHTFRIPALVVTKTGALIAICEGRKTSRSDHGDVDLVLKRSEDGGRTWGSLEVIHEEGGAEEITIGNPRPVVDQDTGVIWLPFTRDNDDVLVTSSRDDGKTWKKPRVITGDVKRSDWTWYATGPGNGIQLARGEHDGRLVIPCDHRVKSVGERRKSTRSHVIYSDDHGQTWKIGGITDFLMNECAIVERVDGSLLLNMRSNRGVGRRGVATSEDGGASWSDCRDAPVLVEPVCQASMIRYSWPTGSDPGRVLFANPASIDGRHHLTVRLSHDDGRTWPLERLLYAGSSAYSSLAVLEGAPSRSIGVLFERDDHGKISLARFDLKWLERDTSSLRLFSEALELRPQGAPGDDDGLHDTFGYLNEQVIWITHGDSPGRSGLRVPEFARWRGWDRPAEARGYQVGQKWRQDEKTLFFKDCALNYPQSPGVLSACVELLEKEVVRVTMTVENRRNERLEGVNCHLCWNHYQHKPLGEDVWARVGESWVDFARYVTPRYRNFHFDREPGTQAGPDITVRALFTEYEKDGKEFSAFIAAPTARTLMSNANWPCTDLNVDFGDIEPGASATRRVFLGLGPHDREHWLGVVRRLLE